MTTLCEDTIQDLMRRFGAVMDAKLAEANKELATKSDLKMVTETVTLNQWENDTLREEVLSLRAELRRGDRRLDYIDYMIRRNNLIFYSLTNDGVNNLRGAVEHFIRQILNVTKPLSIRQVVCLGGKTPNSGLMVKFGDYEDVSAIAANTKRLKNTDSGVNRDFSHSVRKACKCLFSLQDDIKRRNPSLKTVVRSEFLRNIARPSVQTVRVRFQNWSF